MSYQWIALYRDLSELRQFARDGSENRYVDIDRSRLMAFVVLTQEDAPKPVLVMHIPDGGRLIYRKRHEQWGNAPDQKRTVWLVGMQTTERGVNKQSICAIFPDGHIEVTDAWKDDHPWLYPIQPVPGEDWVE